MRRETSGWRMSALTIGGTTGWKKRRQPTVDEGGTGEFVVATDARRKEVYWARYAADYADRVWSFSWSGGQNMPTEYPDLRM